MVIKVTLHCVNNIHDYQHAVEQALMLWSQLINNLIQTVHIISQQLVGQIMCVTNSCFIPCNQYVSVSIQTTTTPLQIVIIICRQLYIPEENNVVNNSVAAAFSNAKKASNSTEYNEHAIWTDKNLYNSYGNCGQYQICNISRIVSN